MTVDLLRGIVRIEANKGIGTGFVISDDGLILTCAHVLGRSMPETVHVVFQSSGEGREAVVVEEAWRGVDAEDVALLNVSGGLPARAQPLPLGSSEGTEGHSMVTFGYPEQGEVEGARGTGKIVGHGAKTRAGQPLLQLESSQITEGFSGAPIWDERRQRVIGMVVIAVERDALERGGKTAYATPTQTLRTIVRALQISDICPYLTLHAFTEKDAPFFFGRQSTVDELVYSLLSERRFLAVFGPSGCGKSSLVMAGLIPRLRAGKDIPESDRWEIVVARQVGEFHIQLSRLDNASPPTVIILDQFEEIFVTSSESVRTEVVAQITHLLEDVPNITLIVVMRNDFYPRFVQQETLERWVKHSYNVPLLIRRKELVSIVEEPAKLVGIKFQDGLIERIVNDALDTTYKHNKDAASSTILPLLESALTQLWERQQDGILTHDAYIHIRGVTGALTQWADQTFYSFEKQQQPMVSRLFTSLIHLGDREQNIPDTRRRRELSSLVQMETEPGEVHKIVQRLADARLLVVSQDAESKNETVEIIHDALLREWGTLQKWVEDDRRFLFWHQELERRMHAWVETNPTDPAKRDPYKLFAGSDLTEAIEWLNTRSSDLREDERAFIQASQESRKRYTRRTVLLAGLAGLGLTVSAITVSRLLFSKNKPMPRPPSLPLPYSYRGHANVVTSVAWSHDGGRVASASTDGTVQVWDAASGRTLRTYNGLQTQGVTSVAWSPDDRRLASASFDRKVQVWDATSGQTLLTYNGHTNPFENIVTGVAWSPDGRHLASACDDGTVRVWDATNGRTLRTYNRHTKSVNSVAWSHHDRRVASASTDGTVQVWDAMSGQTLLTYNGHTDPLGNVVNSVAWSSDDRRLASANEDGTVQVWDAMSGQTLLSYNGHTKSVTSIAWAPDGRHLASAGFDVTIQVWDATSGRTVHTYDGNAGMVHSLAWAPDGRHLASACEGWIVQVWDTSNGQILLTYNGHMDSVNSVAWAPDGSHLASASNDQTVQVWDATSGQTLLTYSGHTTFVVNSVVWSPDGKRLASASNDQTVQIWDATSGQTLLTYKGHTTFFVKSVAWSHDGRHLASAGDDGVQVWDAASGQTLLTYNGQMQGVNSVAWSPDDRRLASAGADQTVQVWDATSGQTLLTYNGYMLSVAWSPDGRRLASGGFDGTVQVWDATSGQTLLTYRGHNGPLGSSVKDVAWAPDGRHLASAGFDGTVRVWDATSERSLLTYSKHADSVNSVAWSPEGSRLASASNDQTVQLWLWLQD